MIITDQRDTFDARGISSHRAGIGFAETDGHAFGRDQYDFVAGANHGCVHQFVAFTQFDRDDATTFWPAVLFKWCLFDQPAASSHHHVVALLIEIPDRQTFGNPFFFFKIQQIDNGTATTVTRQLWKVVYLLPAYFAGSCEEQQVSMRAGNKQMFDRVRVVCLGSLESFATAFLGVVNTGSRAFDVARMTDGYHHRLFGNQILDVDVSEFDL